MRADGPSLRGIATARRARHSVESGRAFDAKRSRVLASCSPAQVAIPGTPRGDDEQTAFRLEPEPIERLDAHAEALMQAQPGLRVTRRRRADPATAALDEADRQRPRKPKSALRSPTPDSYRRGRRCLWMVPPTVAHPRPVCDETYPPQTIIRCPSTRLIDAGRRCGGNRQCRPCGGVVGRAVVERIWPVHPPQTSICRPSTPPCDCSGPKVPRSSGALSKYASSGCKRRCLRISVRSPMILPKR